MLTQLTQLTQSKHLTLLTLLICLILSMNVGMLTAQQQQSPQPSQQPQQQLETTGQTGFPLAWAEKKHLVLLATADLHGALYPFDHAKNKPEHRCLTHLASIIRRLREEAPQAILVDVGDTLQGSPLLSVHQTILADEPNPMIRAMNHLRYDAMVVGNHDFNYGFEHLASAAGLADFPVLGGNVMRDGVPCFRPWVIIERHGLKIGIIGVTTPGIPHWEDPDHYAGLTFTDPIMTVRQAVTDARAAGAEIVVVAAHIGLGVAADTGLPRPSPEYAGNRGIEIARDIPHVDAIFLGHTHETVATTSFGVPLAQPKSYGAFLARIDLWLHHNGHAWEVTDSLSQVIPVLADTPADPPLLALSTMLEARVRRYLERPIGTSPCALPAMGCAFVDNPVTDFMLDAMRGATGADVALLGLPPGYAAIPSGTVRIRDTYTLAGFDNRLVTVSLSPAQIKEVLEHSSRFYLSWQQQTSHQALINREVPFFDCVLAAGIEYEIDLREPVGHRIKNLRRQGVQLAPTRLLRTVVSSYQMNGGGDFPALKQGKDIRYHDTTIRDAIITWFRIGGGIRPRVDHNFRFLPEEIADLPPTPKLLADQDRTPGEGNQ